MSKPNYNELVSVLGQAMASLRASASVMNQMSDVICVVKQDGPRRPHLLDMALYTANDWADVFAGQYEELREIHYRAGLANRTAKS